MPNREDFSARTKRVIAARAGFRCSIPRCNRVTIGPDSAPNKFALTGKAAHIFSASKGGPRGRGGLAPEQLKSISNAIWLCSEHADLVDKNLGLRYPPALLQSYKSLQEAKIAREQRGLFAPIGWFQQLVVHRSPLFEPKTRLQFGKVTLIIGGGWIGKSALCEWIAGFGDPGALWRWMPKPNNQLNLDIEVLCHIPEEQTVRLEVAPDALLKFCINERECPVQPLPLRFVFLKEERLSKSMAEIDDVELICANLNVDPVTLPSLFTVVDKLGLGWARNLRFVEEKDDEEKTTRKMLLADVYSTIPGLQFRVLSGTEQTFVLIEIAVALARFSAQYTPTMLILDGGMWRFGADLMAQLATHLSSVDHFFQTIIVTPHEPEDSEVLRWAGWVTVSLERGANGTTISQQPF